MLSIPLPVHYEINSINDMYIAHLAKCWNIVGISVFISKYMDTFTSFNSKNDLI